MRAYKPAIILNLGVNSRDRCRNKKLMIYFWHGFRRWLTAAYYNTENRVAGLILEWKHRNWPKIELIFFYIKIKRILASLESKGLYRACWMIWNKKYSCQIYWKGFNFQFWDPVSFISKSVACPVVIFFK